MQCMHKSMFDWFGKEKGMINHLEINEGIIEEEEPKNKTYGKGLVDQSGRVRECRGPSFSFTKGDRRGGGAEVRKIMEQLLKKRRIEEDESVWGIEEIKGWKTSTLRIG